ncbi:MAG TPA: DUF3667 domain-containing protein [Flavitalea sp.]|nr:DUF3667 domain-containing protein [Flavitalea sp.]
MSPTCLNCSTPLTREANFCIHCGQSANVHRLTLHDILHDTFHFFTHADKGFLQLLKALILKNGQIARDYIEGKRKKYFPPINFYLIVAAIFVLVINLLIPHNRVQRDNHISREIPENIYEVRRTEAVAFINKYSNFVAMIAVPLITVIFRLFYWKGRFNYTEHLIANLYMNGFTNLVYVLLIVPLSILIDVKNSYVSLGFLLLYQVAYDSIFYYRFMGRNSGWAYFKALMVSVTAVVFWFVLSGFLVGVYIATGFGVR